MTPTNALLFQLCAVIATQVQFVSGSFECSIGFDNCDSSCRFGNFSTLAASTTCSSICESFQLLVESPADNGVNDRKFYCVNDPPLCIERGDVAIHINMSTTTGSRNHSTSTSTSTNSNNTLNTTNHTIVSSTALDHRCRCGSGLIGDCARGGYCPLIDQDQPHAFLCRNGEFCWSTGRCHSFPEATLKLEVIDPNQLKLNIDMLAGRNVPTNAVFDVAWTSIGVPGQSQHLIFQRCMTYNVAVNSVYSDASKRVMLNAEQQRITTPLYFAIDTTPSFGKQFNEATQFRTSQSFVNICLVYCEAYLFVNVVEDHVAKTCRCTNTVIGDRIQCTSTSNSPRICSSKGTRFLNSDKHWYIGLNSVGRVGQLLNSQEMLHSQQRITTKLLLSNVVYENTFSEPANMRTLQSFVIKCLVHCEHYQFVNVQDNPQRLCQCTNTVIDVGESCDPTTHVCVPIGTQYTGTDH